MAASESVMSKLRGLLERAQHPDTSPEERDACRARAQGIKDKFAIEEHELNMADPTRASRPIVRDVMLRPRGSSGYWAGHIGALWAAFAGHCGISYRIEYKNEGKVARSVGYESDISFAEMLFAMASLEFYARIEPGWDVRRSFDDNVKRLKDSGKKWVEIAQIANRNGGNPRTKDLGSTTNGAWLQSAYRRECERLGVEPTRHTQRHDAFRRSFADSFVSEIDLRLALMRRSSDSERGQNYTNLPAIVDRTQKVKAEFYRMYPDMHPDEVRRRSEAAAEAETARREALSPDERAREDAQNQRWWNRYEKDQVRQHDPNGWSAGAEAARNVDLTGGSGSVKQSAREALA